MSPLPAWLGRHDLSGCLKEIMIAPIRIGLASKLPGAPARPRRSNNLAMSNQ